MSTKGIKITLTGFEKKLEAMKMAGANIDTVCRQAITESAKVVETELKGACASAGVPSSISSAITTETEISGNRYSAKVGWKLGGYDPKNPSVGYKAIFLNYGTAKRFTKERAVAAIGGEIRTLGTARGEIVERQFISKAKEASKPKVAKIQREIIKDALKGVSE